MKVMHLADLHLGKVVMGHSMILDQEYIIDKVLQLINDKGIEVVLIAGDVYDRGVPSIEAVNLFSNFLTRMYKMGVKVFIISGNHDSNDRLSFGNVLFSVNDIFIEGSYLGELVKRVVYDEYGKLNIYMLPFVRPIEVRKCYPDSNVFSYHDAIRYIIDRADIDVKERNILMVHQFVTASGMDVVRSDSEVLSLGGMDNVDVHLFDSFDYVAMGHIHRGQRLVRDCVRYAGSILKYSFSEIYQKKSVPIITFGCKGEVEVELVDLLPIRDMRIIKGKMAELLDKNFCGRGNVNDYTCVVLTDDDYVIGAIDKLRQVYPNVLRLEYDNLRSMDSDIKVEKEEVQKKSSALLFEDFYWKQNHVELDEERKKVVLEVIREVEDETD